MKLIIAPIHSIRRQVQRVEVQRNFLFLILVSIIGILTFFIWFDDIFILMRKKGPLTNKILCWVLTQPDSHYKKAIHVKVTWGERCDGLIFISTVEDPYLPSIKLPNVPSEGRQFLWAKTLGTLQYLYSKHLHNYDWFMKADDDTYVIVNNLRKMVRSYSPDAPIYFGCRFKPYVKQGYMSGGAGYVMSREALRRFVEIGVNSNGCKTNHTEPEDLALGRCMEAVGVMPGDSRDTEGRHRFMPFFPEFYFSPASQKGPEWYWNYLYYPQSLGYTCCSDTAISFHYGDFYLLLIQDLQCGYMGGFSITIF